MLSISIVSGSIRKGRNSHPVAIYLQQYLQSNYDTASMMLDLAALSLPPMEQTFRSMENPPENLKTFSESIKNADGIIWVSPEYHGNYSGSFKNAIDYIAPEFKRKAVGICTVSTGKLGGINASNQMQLLALTLGAQPSNPKLLSPFADKLFDENGKLQDEGFEKMAKRFFDEFLWLAEALKSQREKG